MSGIGVVDWSPQWTEQFDAVSAVLRLALADVPSAAGDLGVTGREAFHGPDEPRRNVYVCTAGTLNVRNHLAVRDVLRSRDDLREAYAAVKRALAADPGMDIDTYLAGKSAVLQQVLEMSGEMTRAELDAIRRLNGG